MLILFIFSIGYATFGVITQNITIVFAVWGYVGTKTTISSTNTTNRIVFDVTGVNRKTARWSFSPRVVLF